jgi:hypothetical protein
MASIALSFWLFVGYVAFPLIAIAGFVLHYRLKEKATLTLAIGLAVSVAGLVIELLSPTTHSGFPLSWYLGTTIIYVGISVACVGFVWLSLIAGRIKGRDI